MKKLLAVFALGMMLNLSAFAESEMSTATESNTNSTETSNIENTPAFDATQPLHQPSHFQQLVCYSEDHHGYTYTAVGYDAHQTQHEAHHRCEHQSHGDCWDLGCRYY